MHLIMNVRLRAFHMKRMQSKNIKEMLRAGFAEKPVPIVDDIKLIF